MGEKKKKKKIVYVPPVHKKFVEPYNPEEIPRDKNFQKKLNK